MGKVLVVYRIMPESVDVNLDEVIEKLKEIDGFKDYEKEPIAFGLVAIKASFIVADEKGGSEEIEKRIKNIGGIGEIDVVDIKRLFEVE